MGAPGRDSNWVGGGFQQGFTGHFQPTMPFMGLPVGFQGHFFSGQQTMPPTPRTSEAIEAGFSQNTWF